jgi:hypothetical protein
VSSFLGTTTEGAQKAMLFSITLVLAAVLATQMPAPILEQVMGRPVPYPPLDWVVTVLVLGAGTEGVNAVMKGLDYRKRVLKLQGEQVAAAQVLSKLADASRRLDYRAVTNHAAVFNRDPRILVDADEDTASAVQHGVLRVTYDAGARTGASDAAMGTYFDAYLKLLLVEVGNPPPEITSVSAVPR